MPGTTDEITYTVRVGPQNGNIRVNGVSTGRVNDVAGVRRTFGRFRIEAVETHYSASGGHGKQVGEVLISPA